MPAAAATPGARETTEIRIFQIHGALYHKNEMQHERDCRHYPTEEQLAETERKEEEAQPGSWYYRKRARREAMEKRRRELQEGNGGYDPGADVDDDTLKTEYAAAMSEVEPETVRIRFDAIGECTLACAQQLPDPRRWSDCPARGGDGAEKTCTGLRDLLKKFHNDRTVTGVDMTRGENRVFTQRQLIDKILAEKDCSKGGKMGGMVVIRHGKETATDLFHKRAFSFCFQKQRLSAERDLGEWTRTQAAMVMADEEDPDASGLAKLRSMSEKDESTVARLSFGPGGETLDIDQFRRVPHLRKRYVRTYLLCTCFGTQVAAQGEETARHGGSSLYILQMPPVVESLVAAAGGREARAAQRPQPGRDGRFGRPQALWEQLFWL